MKYRILIWTIVIAVIAGFGWYKRSENRRDARAMQAWGEEYQQRLADVSDLVAQTANSLHDVVSSGRTRDEIERELNAGNPLPARQVGRCEVAEWTHPRYGINVELTFHGNDLVSWRFNYARLTAVKPRPLRVANTGVAESVRQFATRWLPWLWLAALLIVLATVATRRYRYLAVEVEVLAACLLAYFVAWLVSPFRAWTFRDILFDNGIFFIYVMLLVVLVCIAFCIAQQGYRARLQFRLRTMLAFMTVAAVLMAMGGVTVWVIALYLVGAVTCFLGAWQFFGTCVFAKCAPPRGLDKSSAAGADTIAPPI